MGRVHNMTGGGGGVKLSFIAVTTPPTKTAYYVGDAFNPAGMVVKATYTNGAVGTVGGYSCSPSRALSLTDTTITITYTEGGVTKTTTQVLTVTKQTVAVPTPSSLTYNGSAQAPTWTGYDSTKMSKTETAKTNVGTYSTTFALLDSAKCEWADHTTGNKAVSWSIAQTDPMLNVCPTTLAFSIGTTVGTINASGSFDGAVNASSDNTAVATVSVNGTIITVASTGASGTANISVSVSAGTNYKASGTKTCVVTAQFTPTFGVMWTYSNPSTALTRLTADSDPNGYVNASITTEPMPAIGTGTGSSPFDSVPPWSGMDEFNVIDNAVSYQKGNDNFSRTAYDTVVRIPKFYYKIITDSTNSKMYFYVAPDAATLLIGFSVHPAFLRGDGVERDYIYVGRYHDVSGYYSKSGAEPLTAITRPKARTSSANKGASWWQYDLATLSAIQLLYLVEYADWDCQAKIGRGNVKSDAVQTTGGTDGMIYHTGRASGVDGEVQAQYRHIEELWGNVGNFCDGCNINDGSVYVCTNPANFADDTSANYTEVGTLPPPSQRTGHIKRIANANWVLLPAERGGSETSYVPDCEGYYDGWRVLITGGFYWYGLASGLFSFDCVNSSLSFGPNLGARLIFLP